jgi:nucleoside phosphorylase
VNFQDQPLYLHFLDRELNRAVNQWIDAATTERILKTLLLGTTSKLYCGVSLLWESPGIDTALIPFVSMLLRGAALDAVSHHLTTAEFMESRRILYAHDVTRYPMYFSKLDDCERAALSPTLYKDSSTTNTLNEQLLSWAVSQKPRGADLLIESEALTAARKKVSTTLKRRSNEAITFSLFSGGMPTAKARATVSGIVQREISLQYAKHYKEFADGNIPTGIAGFDFFDSNLAEGFPLYDLPVLTAVLKIVGLAQFLEQPWRVHEGTWARSAEWRGAFVHSEFRSDLRLVLLALKALALKKAVSREGTRYDYAFRQAILAALRHSGVRLQDCGQLDWEDALFRLGSLVRQLSNSVEFAASIETARQAEGTSRVDVLLVTVNDIEKAAVLDGFKREVGHGARLRFGVRKTYYDLGTLGGARVVMVQSEMGSVSPGASFSTVAGACDELHPRGVIAVGIAFGVDRKRQDIGDVLVSKQVLPYDVQRVGTGADGATVIIPRAGKPDASSRLVDRLRSAKVGWTNSEVSFGLILSGEKLVDNIDYRGQIVALAPEALGGEMEAAGTYSAAYDRNTDWIIVKGICDWADGKKRINKTKRQKLAAENSASLVIHAIKLGGLADTRSKVV